MKLSRVGIKAIEVHDRIRGFSHKMDWRRKIVLTSNRVSCSRYSRVLNPVVIFVWGEVRVCVICRYVYNKQNITINDTINRRRETYLTVNFLFYSEKNNKNDKKKKKRKEKKIVSKVELRSGNIRSSTIIELKIYFMGN